MNSSKIFGLAPRMEGVESSPTLRLNALAQELIRQGKDVVNLTAGETDFETPMPIRLAAEKALAAGHTRYTPPHGTPELRQAVAAWFQRDFALKYTSKQITVTCGVKQGLFNLILATVGPGDEVLIPAPYWVSYPEMVRLAGGTPVILPVAKDFGLDIPALKAALNARTRLLVLNFPNNPTGAMCSEADYREVAKLLEGTNVLVASDEIYSSLCYDGVKMISFAALSADAYARTITFNGLSKSHAMTGWRVGFAAGNEQIIEAMGILQAQSATNVTTFVQDASVEALKQTQSDFEPRRLDMEARRNKAISILKKAEKIKIIVPKGAFYAFPDVSAYYHGAISGSEAMSEYLLTEAGVATVPGKPFGEDRCIRLSFARDMVSLEKGLERLVAALQKL